MLSREDIARIAKEAVAACPPIDGDSGTAGDLALRQMWKALGKTKLATVEIDRLRDDMLAAVRDQAAAASNVRQASGAAAAINHPPAADRGFDLAAWRGRVAVLVSGVFEATFDGTSRRVDVISDRARSLVEAMIATEALSIAEADMVKRLAEDAIASERAALT
jgi:hypothetical protein